MKVMNLSIETTVRPAQPSVTARIFHEARRAATAS
jgi:hypothetical protein